MNKKLLIFTTGGTIDKSYSEADGSIKNRETIIRDLVLSKLRLPYTEVEISEIMAKDSLEMTDIDRELILDSIRRVLDQNCPVIIIHGTDTMADSMRYCFQRLKDLTVPIIFTGAMKPAVIADSDSQQNITEALLAAKILKPGVYISFHGEIFEAPNITKNKSTGTFEYTN